MHPLILSLLSSLLLLSSGFAQAPVAENPAATLPTDENPHLKNNTKWRFAKYMAQLAQTSRPIHLIFDGDSITDGWQNAGRAVWEANFAQRRAFNFGIGGERTQHVLWRLANGQIKDIDPKMVVLLIGTNNSAADTPEQIAEGIKAIIAQYQKLCPNAVILLQGVFPRSQNPTDPIRAVIKNINQRISTLGDGEKVIYVDFGDKFLEPDGTISPSVMHDFVHPSPKGYQIWADAITPIVDKYCPIEK